MLVCGRRFEHIANACSIEDIFSSNSEAFSLELLEKDFLIVS